MKRLGVLRRIAPEISELVDRRHALLQSILVCQPVGRRALAVRLGWPERLVRKETDFLRDLGLIVSEASGMELTPAGESLLEELKEIVRELYGLAHLEKELARRLDLQRVIVVPGDADQDSVVRKEIALATARFLDSVLRDGDVLAVAEGSTLAEVAQSLPPASTSRQVTVVPARGGLGEDVELQANTIAAAFAQRLGGSYRLLHVPDNLGQEAINSLSSEPKIQELLELIRSARIVLHGIGTAEEIARRRGMPLEIIDSLKEKEAVGEAFGYYFDRRSNIVFATTSVGMRFEDLENVELVVAVGGGRSKAEAALAVLSTQHQHVYITDEGAARAMLRHLTTD